MRAHGPAYAVEAAGVARAFDHRPVLRGVDLRVRTGETVAVLGANGAGKSTLLRILASVLRPTRGTVVWFGDPDAPAASVRRRLALVPHESLLYDGLTVEENLRFFAGLYGLPSARAAEVLEALGLGALRTRRARVLSRGQRQQVDLARALLHDPVLLLLDEPFTGLDLEAAARLAATLRAIGASRTVIFATHDPAQARALADRAAVLRGGRVAVVEPAAALDDAALAAWFREALA
ncbi:MAG: ABC transporter ATP-binding protein [Armatimonadota bacterium]|nr:ABC transporter ATP-binding protein [Armatimonadota bacterium]